MALEQLRFNGCNGRSRILRGGGEELTLPLMWLDELTLLPISKSEMLKGETQEEFYRWIVESNKPKQAMYFARSEDYNNLYLGVQYYCVAGPHDPLDPGIPVGSPKMVPLGASSVTSDINRLIQSIRWPKDAADYVHKLDESGRFAVVQYYKPR